MTIINLVYEPPTGGGGWQPGANTLYYLPLSASTTTSNYGNLNHTFTQTGGSFVGNHYEATDGNCHIVTSGNAYSSYTSYTIMCWVKYILGGVIGINNWGNGDNGNVSFYTDTCERYNGGFGRISYPIASLEDGSWHHLVLLGQSGVLYFDGVQAGTSSRNVQLKPRMVGINSNRPTASAGGNAYYSEFIMEDKIWTAQEISDYYNQTKSNYGRS